jgi:hypothetical protein
MLRGADGDGAVAALLAGVFADRFGRTPVIFVMATVSAICSLAFGWMLGASLVLIVAVGLLYGFAALGDSPIYSTAITGVVAPAYRGAALALRSTRANACETRSPLRSRIVTPPQMPPAASKAPIVASSITPQRADSIGPRRDITLTN